MIQSFRKFFASKFGIAATLVFLGLIAFAFASSDIANTALGSGVSGSDRVAVVGKEKIGTADLQTAANNSLQRMREQDPRLSMPGFIAQGGLDDVLDQLVERASLSEFGRVIGLRVSDRLIDSEILQIPVFRGADGKFDRQTFLAVIGQQGLSEAAVRKDMSSSLMARQLAAPVMQSTIVPQSFGSTYASLLRETRRGAIAGIPSAAFAPTAGPSEAQLAAFYKANSNDYIRPERRIIRYASFGEEALKSVPAPTEAQIAARYQRDRVQYAATERRSFTQLVAPTQAAAQAIAAQVKAGKSLDIAAREQGLATTKVERVTKTEFTTSASAAVANSGFAATSGALAAPARGGLGWYVLRVDAIDRQAEKPLAQVRSDISAVLAVELRRAALSDMTARIEEELDSGTGLADMAKELGLAVTSTAPVTGDGTVYGKPGERVPQLLGPVMQVAFDMEEGEPQLAEVIPGQAFVIFDVTDITPSAAAPLAEIRSDVIAAWKRDRGNALAKQAADRILARVAKGMPLAQAVSAEDATLPAPQSVTMAREELARTGQVPPPLALMFSMAKGSVKKLEERGDAGWFVVQLADIQAGKVDANDPIIAATLRELGSVAAEEYAQQFVVAVGREVKAERNADAVAALRAQLAGTDVN